MIRIPLALSLYCIICFLGHGQSLQFTQTEYDLGSVSDLEAILQIVKFQNVGNEPLIIERVKASCGCTTGELDKKVYEPMEYGELRVTFDPSGREGQERKGIKIFSNDGTNQLQSIAITADVIASWNIEPKLLEFRFDPNSNSYDRTKGEFKIINHGPNDMLFDSLEFDQEKIKISIPEKKEIKVGESITASVSINPNVFPTPSKNVRGSRLCTCPNKWKRV